MTTDQIKQLILKVEPIGISSKLLELEGFGKLSITHFTFNPSSALPKWSWNKGAVLACDENKLEIIVNYLLEP